MPEFNCPKCGSEETAKCSAVFAAGTTAIETKTSGMGVGLTRGGFVPVVGSGTTRGVQQTQLAARLAPPARESGVKYFFLGTFVLAPVLGIVVAIVVGIVVHNINYRWENTAMLVTFLVVTAIIIVLTIAACIRNHCYNRDEWPGLYREWEQKWYCGRCGEVFIPGGPEAVARDDG